MTEEDTQEFSDEELEALAGEELPDRAAMARLDRDPAELAAAIDELGGGADPSQG
jgi:hypothetical protein